MLMFPVERAAESAVNIRASTWHGGDGVFRGYCAVIVARSPRDLQGPDSNPKSSLLSPHPGFATSPTAPRKRRSLGCVTVEILAALAAVVLALVGLIGIVFPVLPGSILVGAGALVWALWGASGWGWVAFGMAAFLVILGATSSLVLTGRSLRSRNVPKWPVTIGILVGIVGMFVLPGFGLPIGFTLGLLLAEWYRMRSFRGAAVTSWETIKALGLGILVEFGCAMVATSILAVSILTAW